jgi:hypothetical protein
MTVEFKRTPGGAILLDGNALRDETVAKIRREIDAAGNPSVCLATVLVGDDRPSHIYVANKHKKAGEAGMLSHGVALNGKASQAQVEDEVGKLAQDPSIHGILVQLPLPSHLDPEPVLALLPPEKDVDGLTVHATRRDALDREVQHPDQGQARRRDRSLDLDRHATDDPAHPQGWGCDDDVCTLRHAAERFDRDLP